MQTQDQAKIRRKAMAMSAIMKNPKLSEAIFDAWDAPIGSSRRAKARDILSSVGKASQIEDGQGGWMGDTLKGGMNWLGNAAKSAVSSVTKSTTAPSKTPIVVKSIDSLLGKANAVKQGVAASKLGSSIPTGKTLSPYLKGLSSALKTDVSPAINKGLTAAASPKGTLTTKLLGKMGTAIALAIPTPTSALGDLPSWEQDAAKKSPFLGSDSKNSFLNASGSIFNPQKKSDLQHPTLAATKNSDKQTETKDLTDADRYFTVNGIDIYDLSTMSRVTEAQAKAGNIWGKINKISSWNDLGEDFSSYFSAMDGATQNYMYLRNTDPNGISSAEAAEMSRIMYGVAPDTELAERRLNSSPATNPSFGVGTLSNMSPQEREVVWNDLNPSEQSLWGKSFEMANQAYAAGMGAEGFAQKIMGNKKILASFLDLSEAEAAALPESPLLSGQLNDLRDLVDGKNRIDEQLNDILKLKNRGVSIEDDLQTYIGSKDEYLGQIDDLIARSKTIISDMDTSDPHVAERMGNYINYLTILQGRQNKRYIDFLAMGVKEHQNELTIATNLYEASITKAEKEYNAQAAVTAEEYANLKAAIKDAYNAVGEKEDRIMKIEKHNADMALNGQQLTNSVLENQKLKYEMLNPTTETEPITGSQYDLFKQFVGETKKDGDKEYFSFNTLDPADVRAQVGTSGYEENASDLTTQYLYTQMKKSVSDETSYGSTSTLYDARKVAQEKANAVSSYNKQMSETNASYSASDEAIKALYEQDAADILATLESGATSGIAQYLSQEGKSEVLRKALRALGQVGKEAWYDISRVSEKSFVKDFGGENGLGDEYAKSLYNGVLAESKSSNMSAADYVQRMNDPTWDSAGAIARNLIY